MRSLLFWGVSQLRLVVTCRRFGKTFRAQSLGCKQFEKKSEYLTLDGVRFPGRGRRFIHSPNSIRALTSSEFSFYISWESFPRLKGQGPKFIHSPLSSAEVQNEWSRTSSPPICLHE